MKFLSRLLDRLPDWVWIGAAWVYVQLFGWPERIMNEIKFTVPLVPPSVNHYVKHTRSGRHYVTAEAKAFKEAVVIFARGCSIFAKGYEVHIGIYLPKGVRGDIDNFLKVTLDALVSARVIHSDAYIEALHVCKGRDRENPRTEITVRALSGESR